MRRRRRCLRHVAVLTGATLVAAGLGMVAPDPAQAAVTPRCLGAPPVLPIAGSAANTTYTFDRNGGLWGWGENYFGQIGDGSRTGLEDGVTSPLNASGFNNFQAVAAGYDHVLALTQDGSVWAWGDNQYGQVGNGQMGFNIMQTTPVRVQGLPANVVAIAATHSSFAITAEGTVWAWGRNDEGQLGNNSTTNLAVATQVMQLTGYTAFAGSQTHTVGLKANGDVYAWGDWSNGKLGPNAPSGPDRLTPVFTGVTGAIGVAAGAEHSVALKGADGSVWSWGFNAYGQLGNGNFTSTATPQSAGLTGIGQVSGGGYYTLALTATGLVKAWGGNTSGELGTGTGGPSYQPTAIQVATISGVKAVEAGGNHAVALTSSGAVWTWGANYSGGIGDGGFTDRWTPYQTAISQSTPAVPTKLEAVAGDRLAYLTWTPPISAVTQYVITPYLNGVAQPEVAAPAGSSSYTVSGLVIGGNYAFTVAAQNCLGTGPATAKSNPVVPTGTQLNDAGNTTESSRLTDRMSLHVNTFTGNLSVTESDIGIKGTGLDLGLSRTYNDMANTTSIFGNNWSVSGGTDVRLVVQGDGSVLMTNSGGSQVGFAKKADGTFASPSGIDATLVKNPDLTYTLSYHFTGVKWRFASSGALTSQADRNNNTITFAYGGPGGALSAITDTQNRTTTLTYNASNLVSSVTDPGGRLYQYAYDAAKNLTTYTDPASGITRFTYDGVNNLTQITTPAGRVVGLTYDASKRATAISRPLQAGNPTTTFAYNAAASQTVVTDANGRPTTYTYDSVGRTTKTTDALGNQTSASYTANSNVATQQGAAGTGSTYAYDGLNNLSKAAVQPGAHSTIGYDDPSHPHSPTKVTDPQNNTTTYAYDAAGNLVAETTPLASENQVQLTRNTKGLVTTSRDPKGNQTSYGYDVKGNLTSVTPPAPLGAQTVAYDALSRPTTLTDGKGQVTTIVYDALDRVKRSTYQDGKSVNRAYDADGNLTCMTDAAVGTTCTGAVTTMAYDAMGRLTQRTTPGGPTVSYTYDKVGNLLTLTDPGGTTTYAYNAVNLPTTVTAPGTGAITLGYDANYNRTSVAYPNGVTIYSTYDGANRLVRVNTVRAPSTTLNDLNYSYTPPSPTKASAKAVTMRGSPSTYATNGMTTTAVTLATPTGLAPGDVEVAQISVSAGTTITSVPAGWTLIRQDVAGTGLSDLRQALYSHVAESSEPLRYTWGLSQATEANGGLTAWTGVDTASPVQTSSGRVDTTGHADYAATVLADRPAGYWRLGESVWTAADDSGNGITGTYQGGVTFGQPGALVGDTNKAASFDGSSGYVWLGLPPALQPNNLTLEAWFKTTILSGTIIRSRWYGYNLGIGAGRLTANVCGTPSLGCPVVQSAAGVSDNQWHHAALTKNGSQLTLYLDGAAVASTPMTEATYYAPGGIAIGRDGDANGAYFNGYLDDVAVYPKALTGGRVAAHYQAGRSAPANPPWVAPSVPYTNGEADLAFYGGRLFGSTSALSVPSGYTSAYDTQTTGLTTGLHSRTMPNTAGTTGDQSVNGPAAWSVAQQVLLRPRYDTALRQSTPAGAMTYDALNRLTGAGSGHAYTYDGVSNRLSQTKGSQVATYTHNGANQLTRAVKAIHRVGTAAGGGTATTSSPSFTVAPPTGTRAGDQILLSVTQSVADTVAVDGFEPVATAAGPTPADAKTVVFRRTATGTGADTATVTPSLGATAAAVGVVYRGVDAAAPIEDVDTGHTTGGTTLTVPGVTSSTVNEQLVVFQGAVANSGPGTWTPPPGLTEHAQNTFQTARSAGVADKRHDSFTGNTGPLSSSIATTGNAPANLAGAALTLRPATTYGYDGNGNLTSSSAGASTFTYDAADRMTAITPSGGKSVSFTYRGAGQAERASMTPVTRVPVGCTDIGGCVPVGYEEGLNATATFLYSQLGLSMETRGALSASYVRDPSGGLLATRFFGGQPYYYLFDAQGSVVGLSDSTGATVASYAYDPYGQLTSMTFSSVAVGNPWRYLGAYLDGSGLYKMGHRYYDPSLGRWTQQDPVFDPLDPKQWNRYVYVGNDPINFTDPTGLSKCGDWSFGGLVDCGAKVGRGAVDFFECIGGEALKGLVSYRGGRTTGISPAVIGAGGALIWAGDIALTYGAGATLYVVGGYVAIAVGATLVIIGTVAAVRKCL